MGSLRNSFLCRQSWVLSYCSPEFSLYIAGIFWSGKIADADDLYLNMKEYLGRNLREAGLIPQTSDLSTILRLASHFCPHNVGHHLVSGCIRG